LVACFPVFLGCLKDNTSEGVTLRYEMQLRRL